MRDLTYAEAVALFEQWGFRVEAGPRTGEVTVILEAADACTTTVHPQDMLPQMAAVILAMRWRNGSVACQPESRAVAVAS